MNRPIVVPRRLATVDARPTSRPLQHGRGATEVLEFRRMAERTQESAPRSPLLPERQRFRRPLYRVVGLTDPARAPAIDNAGALAEYASVPSNRR